MAKVVIDTEECVGCESCVEICPEVFRIAAHPHPAPCKNIIN